MTAPVRRSTIPSAVGETRRRTRSLEATGIDYGENEGDFVNIWAADKTYAPYGINMTLSAGPNPPIGGTTITGSLYSINLVAGDVTAVDPGWIALVATDDDGPGSLCGFHVGRIDIVDGVHPDWNVHGFTAHVPDAAQEFAVIGQDILPCLEIFGDYTVSWETNYMTVKLANTANFEIQDTNGNPIFRVDQDGTIHGLTAVGAITWDL